MKRLLLFTLLAALAPARGPAPLGSDPHPEQEQDRRELELLRKGLQGTGIEIDPGARLVTVPARVLVRTDLLEYLLVGRRGAVHESLFLTEVKPSLLNASLLALGFEPGRNASVREAEDGSPEVLPPAGERSSRLYLYAAWKEADEVYLYRIEDLLTNLETGRAMRRHAWVFLGSRFAASSEGEGTGFVADLEENLVNIAYFYQGNTLATAALEECVRQTIWAPNAWLLPPRDAEVSLVFAREKIMRLPPALEEGLPVVDGRATGPPRK